MRSTLRYGRSRESWASHRWREYDPGLIQPVNIFSKTEDIRVAALDYLWMHNRGWIDMAERGEPLIMVEGEGVRVLDSEGRTWIDPNGGYASVNVGYGRTEIADAAREQLRKLSFQPYGAATEPLIRVAEKIAGFAPGSMERVFPVNGGSESTETAVKIARAYHRRNGEPQRYKIISRRDSYHGATGGVLSMAGSASGDRSDYEPMYPGMIHVPQPNPYRCESGAGTPSECARYCAQRVEESIVEHGPDTIAAFIGEPVSSNAGNAVPGDEYWPMIRDICDRYGILLIADEVICGYGRTGKWFGMDNWGIVPDIMGTAKGIVSSYLPFAATVAKREIADAFAGGDNYFRMTNTFGGHPVSAAAALKNLEIIETEGLVENSARMGKYFRERLRELQQRYAFIGDVRGIGLMNTIEMVSDRHAKTGFDPDLRIPERLQEKFYARRLLLNPVGGQFLNISPPLCVSRADIDEIVDILDDSFRELTIEVHRISG